MRIWSTTDPWTASDTVGSLNQLQAYWLDPDNDMDAAAGPHDLVHFISGKQIQGGVAYVEAVCQPQYEFGVSQVEGAFDVSEPDAIWDVLVFTHEVGHNLGSDHTHCYTPPVDHCYSGEQKSPGVFCYVGPTSVPAGGGTIMSYCHLLPGGLGNVDLVFGDTVRSTIRDFVAGASCLSEAGICGDGSLDSGEQCDDGDLDDGDGCSALCEVEGACGNGIVGAGEQCDDSNTTPGDGLRRDVPARDRVRQRRDRGCGAVRRRQHDQRRRLLVQVSARGRLRQRRDRRHRAVRRRQHGRRRRLQRPLPLRGVRQRLRRRRRAMRRREHRLRRRLLGDVRRRGALRGRDPRCGRGPATTATPTPTTAARRRAPSSPARSSCRTRPPGRR
jgi:cysteine-rich repeat protein